MSVARAELAEVRALTGPGQDGAAGYRGGEVGSSGAAWLGNVAHTDLSPCRSALVPHARLKTSTRKSPLPPMSLTSGVARTGSEVEASCSVSSTEPFSLDRVSMKSVWACITALVASSLTTKETSSTRCSRSCARRWVPTNSRASDALIGSAARTVSCDQSVISTILPTWDPRFQDAGTDARSRRMSGLTMTLRPYWSPGTDQMQDLPVGVVLMQVELPLTLPTFFVTPSTSRRVTVPSPG